MDYYYLDECGNVAGPVSEKALAALLSARVVQPTTMVSQVGASEWVAVAQALKPAAPTEGAASPPPAPRTAPPVPKQSVEAGPQPTNPVASASAGAREGETIPPASDSCRRGRKVPMLAVAVLACVGIWAAVFALLRMAAPNREPSQGGDSNDLSPPGIVAGSAEDVVSELAPAREKMKTSGGETLDEQPSVNSAPPVVDKKQPVTMASSSKPMNLLAEWYEFGYLQGMEFAGIKKSLGEQSLGSKSELIQLIGNLGVQSIEIEPAEMDMCLQGFSSGARGEVAAHEVSEEQRQSNLPSKLQGYRKFKGGVSEDQLADSPELQRLLDCTVLILVTHSSDKARFRDPVLGSGSGFLIAPGMIATNRHVVRDGGSIKVFMPDKSEEAGTLVATSDEFDLALVSVGRKEHPCLVLGRSSEAAVGQKIMAVGFPEAFKMAKIVGDGNVYENFKNLTPNATFGQISNSNSMVMGNPCLTIDAAINHGNSGGPLGNTRGEVIGINTFGLGGDSQGINYAIKIDTAFEFFQQYTDEIERVR